MAIDAVITWVDGNDAAHQTKLATTLQKMGISKPESAAPTRFNQCGEIDYCLRSLLRYAPWLRTLFLVTDNQTPSIIKALKGTPEGKKIKLIDHRDIFLDHENALPTFNSLSIESVLWRIEGLSEQFIYLNDDCALIRPVTPNDFFRENKLVLRGAWKTQTEKKWLNRMMPNRSHATHEHRTIQETSAKLAGFKKKFFHLPHAPLSLHKQTLADFFLQHPNDLLKNIQPAFRTLQQFWPISLAQHLDLKNNTAIVDNTLKAISLHGNAHSLNKIQTRLKRAEKNNVAFICLQSLDLAPDSTRRIVFDWLDSHLSR